MRSKIFLVIIFATLLVTSYQLLVTSPAHALEIPLPITSPETTVADENIAEYIVRIYWFAVGAAGIVAVAVIVGGAVYYMVSSGSPDKQNDAKSYITSALWGVALLLGSYLILNTINPQITTLRAPTGGLADCAGVPGERPAIDCLPKPQEPGTENLEVTKAVACTNVWEECGLTYPEKPGFRATFNKKVRGPFFNCTDDDSCEEDIEIRLIEIDADGERPVTLVAYPFYKLFDSELEPGEQTVRVRCAATYAEQDGHPFIPNNVSIAGKVWDIIKNLVTSIIPGEGPETDLTTTLTACKSPEQYKREGLLP